MSKLQDIKQSIKQLAEYGVVYFTKQKFVQEFEVDERVVRQAISEVGKESINCYFMPMGKKDYYALVTELSEEQINAFAHKLLKSMQTIYFNKYKPIKNYITDEKLKDLMVQLELVFKEKGQ